MKRVLGAARAAISLRLPSGMRRSPTCGRHRHGNHGRQAITVIRQTSRYSRVNLDKTNEVAWDGNRVGVYDGKDERVEEEEEKKEGRSHGAKCRGVACLSCPPSSYTSVDTDKSLVA